MPRPHGFDPDALADLLRRGAGVVRSSDLKRLGMSSSTISYRVGPRGRWRHLLPGVIQTFTGTPSLLQQASGALLYAGNGSILTGLAMLRLCGFRQLPPDSAVHVLVPHRRRRSSSGYATVERTRRLPPHRWVRGIACAPYARAVLDGMRRLTALDEVRAVIAEAVQRGFCSVEALMAELRAAHRRRTRLARVALQEVLAGARSVAEAKAKQIFESASLPTPLWNHDVFDAAGRWVARPDCIWPELGVVLEIDSTGWHLSPASYRRTQARQRRMTKYGLLVIPVSPSQLRDNPKEVLAEILETLAAAKSRPAPVLTTCPA